MRKGPRPLTAHIGMAVAGWAYKDMLERMEEVSDPESFMQAMGTGEVTEKISSMLCGIQKYQTHAFKAQRGPLKEIWREGEASILTPADMDLPEDAPVMLLVPSLVNRAYILDLMPQRSMLRWFASHGMRCYILDWGETANDIGQASISSVIRERLVPAIHFLAQYEKQKIHALGYCMGGTMLVGAAHGARDDLASIIMLAAPWDFHAGTQNLLDRVKFWTPSMFSVLDDTGVLPVDWVQVLFASLDPEMTAKKFSAFLDMEEATEKQELFIAVEDWLNDGVDLPAKVAKTCTYDWFIENEPAKGKWEQDGVTVLPENIKCPVLIVASDKDRLVEYEMAIALQTEGCSKVDLINPHCGHIGMIAGTKCVDLAWAPIKEWVFGAGQHK